MPNEHEEPKAQFGELFTMIWRVPKLTWQAGPHLVGALLIPTLSQAILPPATLALSCAVVNRAAYDRGLLQVIDPVNGQQPLVVWAVLAAAGLALTQVLLPIASGVQSLIGDRLSAMFGLNI